MTAGLLSYQALACCAEMSGAAEVARADRSFDICELIADRFGPAERYFRDCIHHLFMVVLNSSARCNTPRPVCYRLVDETEGVLPWDRTAI